MGKRAFFNLNLIFIAWLVVVTGDSGRADSNPLLSAIENVGTSIKDTAAPYVSVVSNDWDRGATNASQFLDQLYHARQCPDASKAELKVVGCLKQPIFTLKNNLDAVIEEDFFNIAARKQVDFYRCKQNLYKDLFLKNGGDQKALQVFHADLLAKLPALSLLYAQMQDLRKRREETRQLVKRGDGPVPQGNLDLYKRMNDQIDVEQGPVLAGYDKLLQSTPSANFPEGQKMVQRFLAASEMPLDAGQNPQNNAKKISDLFQKLPDLQAIHQKLKDLSQQNESLRKLIIRDEGPIPQGNVELFQRENERITREQNSLNESYDKILQSIKYGNTPERKNLISRLVSTDPVPTMNDIKRAFDRQDQRLKKDIKLFNSQDHQLNRAIKVLLFKEANPSSWLPASADPGLKQNLFCRMNARYGSGADELNWTFTGGSILLGGGAKVVVSKTAASLLFALAGEVSIASTLPEFMAAGSAIFGSPNIVNDLQKQCISDQPQTLNPHPELSCRDTTVGELQSLHDRNCVLSLVFNAPGVPLPSSLSKAVQSQLLQLGTALTSHLAF